MLAAPGMYLREAIRRCQDLEKRAATLYANRAAAPGELSDDAERWAARAKTDSEHANILADLLRRHEACDDDGPFVIDVRQHIVRLREALDEAFANEKTDDPEARSELYSVEFVQQCCDALFERIVRIAELTDREIGA